MLPAGRPCSWSVTCGTSCSSRYIWLRYSRRWPSWATTPATASPSGSRRLNRAVGLGCGNLGIGISYSYWVTKHAQHHAHPNQIGADPDVGPGVICWTPEQAVGKTGLSLAIAKHQAALFFPLTCLEAVNLHILSIRAVRSRQSAHGRTEAILLSAHGVLYLGALLLALSPPVAVAFFVVQQGAFGLYLGCAFAPNHKGMPMSSTGQELSFVRYQVTTARNVRGGRALTLALGGLNYQIEHHLFPSMPMANLRRCRPIVRAYCLAHDIDYCETTLSGSYLAGAEAPIADQPTGPRPCPR